MESVTMLSKRRRFGDDSGGWIRSGVTMRKAMMS